jgi:hypothetical protein
MPAVTLVAMVLAGAVLATANEVSVEAQSSPAR